MRDIDCNNLVQPEPRWPALVATLAAGAVHWALPPSLLIGPGWLPLLIVGLLLIPTIITHRQENHDWNQVLGFTVNSFITLAMVASLMLLIARLPLHSDQPTQLLRSAAVLWIVNVLVFALWYWRLDAGGPHARDKKAGHDSGAFLFPQMTLPDRTPEDELWSPGFVDYLFLAFNTSTALSPTDVPVLSRWAKVLMMLQSLISLAIVVLLAARAINIL